MLKTLVTIVMTFSMTMLICLPLMKFPDEKVEPPKLYYEGKVIKADCNNTLASTKSYITVDGSKFNLKYSLCQSVSEGSSVKVQYSNELEVEEISYISK